MLIHRRHCGLGNWQRLCGPPILLRNNLEDPQKKIRVSKIFPSYSLINFSNVAHFWGNHVPQIWAVPTHTVTNHPSRNAEWDQNSKNKSEKRSYLIWWTPRYGTPAVRQLHGVCAPWQLVPLATSIPAILNSVQFCYTHIASWSRLNRERTFHRV